jgi:hypothetical protein
MGVKDFQPIAGFYIKPGFTVDYREFNVKTNLIGRIIYQYRIP